MKSLVRIFGLASAAAFAAACASVGGGTGGTVTTGGAGPTAEPASPSVIWPVKTREHVDLWLHGFAMLQEDTTFVPFFKCGRKSARFGSLHSLPEATFVPFT